MKQKLFLLILPCLMLSCIAWSQTQLKTDTLVFQRSEVYDILGRLAEGKAAKETLDSLKVWYAEAYRRYDSSQQNVISLLNERDAASKYISTLKASLSAAKDRISAGEVKYQTLYNKRNKAWGIGVSGGYNPFTRLPYTGVGLNFNLIRFSLRGLFADGQSAELPDQNIRVIR